MQNRIRKYTGELVDVDQANDTLAFCSAILRLHGDMPAADLSERLSLARLQGKAVDVLLDFGVPLPWEQTAKR
jgi:hypothetical protein